MKPYIGIVHRDANSAYGISFPDAPGCFSAADSLDDLFGMADEALELWLTSLAESGAVIPHVRDLSTIKADPAWAESFAASVLVIAVRSPHTEVRHAA